MSDDFPIYQNGARYDQIFHSSVDIAYWRGQLQAIKGPILEIGCGTGRLLLEIAADHAEVAGIDLSEPMLHTATQKARVQGRAFQLYKADMRYFQLETLYGAIFVANNTLGHLSTRTDIEAHLACVRKHLRPEGLYLLDIFVPNPALLTEAAGLRHPFSEYIDPENGLTTQIHQEGHYNHATQVNHSLWIYTQNGQIVYEQPFSIRMFFPQELDALLLYNGFEIVAKYGDYDLTLFDEHSRHQLIVARASL